MLAFHKFGRLKHCEAWVSSIIDPSITATDHAAACVDLRFSGFSASKKQAPKSRKMNELNLKGCDLQALRHCDFVPSCTDGPHPCSAITRSSPGHSATPVSKRIETTQEDNTLGRNLAGSSAEERSAENTWQISTRDRGLIFLVLYFMDGKMAVRLR